METLGEALPKEMARVRDEVMPVYVAIGPSGALAVAMIRRDLDTAAKAMADSDTVAMIQALQELRAYKL